MHAVHWCAVVLMSSCGSCWPCVCVGASHQLQFQHKDWEVLWQLLVLGWALLLASGRKRVRSCIRWLRNRCQIQLH